MRVGGRQRPMVDEPDEVLSDDDDASRDADAMTWFVWRKSLANLDDDTALDAAVETVTLSQAARRLCQRMLAHIGGGSPFTEKAVADARDGPGGDERWRELTSLASEAPMLPPRTASNATMLDAVQCVLGYSSSPVLLSSPVLWTEPTSLNDEFFVWPTGVLKSAMLVGDAMDGAVLVSESAHCGLWWLAPHTAYPCHTHEADETLVVVSGGSAEWRIDSAEWHAAGDGCDLRRCVEPGSVLRVPGGAARSVTTFDEPLLVWYLWTGNLEAATSPYALCEHVEPSEFVLLPSFDVPNFDLVPDDEATPDGKAKWS